MNTAAPSSSARRAPLRRALAGGALGAASAALALGCGPPPMPPSVGHPLAGRTAPEFEAESTGELSVSVPGGLRTKATVVDFWASWCAGCSQSIPALDDIWRDHKADGVVVIGVSVDATEGAAVARARQLGASFPIVMDSYQRIAQSYGVARVPLTFVVDARGKVRWVGRDPASARRAVDILLSERGRPRSAFE